jgi:hypothetical protein
MALSAKAALGKGVLRIAKDGKSAYSGDERDLLFSEAGSACRILAKGVLTNAAFSAVHISGIPSGINNRYRKAVVTFDERPAPPLAEFGGIRSADGGYNTSKYVSTSNGMISGTPWYLYEPYCIALTTVSQVEFYTNLAAATYASFFYLIWENAIE